MAPLSGPDVEVSIEDVTPDTYILIDGMDTLNRSNSRSSDKRPTFGRATPYATVGNPDETVTLSGIFNPDDPGQARLISQIQAGVPFKLQVMYDGTNGYTQEFVAGTTSHDASAEPGFQEMSVELTPNADPVIVGTGPLPF